MKVPDRLTVLGTGIVVGLIITIVSGVALNLVRSEWPQIAYPETFRASIYVACGHGYGAPTTGGLDNRVEAFISGDSSVLDCVDVRNPAQLNQQSASLGTYYQQLTVGTWWRLFGISWQSLDWLTAIFLGISAGITFLILRLWLPSLIAAPVAVVSSLPAMPFLVFPRDLMIAPFILTGIFVTIYLVLRQQRTSTFFLSMLGLGVLLGIGLGFRTDVLVALALVTGTVIFFRKGTAPAANAPRLKKLGIGFGGVAILFLSFLLASEPARSKAPENNALAHVALLGLSDETQARQSGYDDRLSVVQQHLDSFNFSMVEAHSNYLGPEESFAPYSKEFGETALDLYLSAIETFPAMHLRNGLFTGSEVLTTGISGIVYVANLGMNGPTENNFPVSRTTFLFVWLVVIMMWLGFVTILLVVDRRVGFFSLFFLLWISYFPMIQFESRHIFYLSFLTWIPLATGISYLIQRRPTKLQSVLKSGTWPANYLGPWAKGRWVFSAITVTSIVLCLGITYAVALVYQSGRTSDLISNYRESSTSAADYIINADGSLTVSMQEMNKSPGWSVMEIAVNKDTCFKGNGQLIVDIELVEPKLETRVPTQRLTWSRELEGVEGFDAFIPILLKPQEIHTLKVSFKPIPFAGTQDSQICIPSVYWLEGKKAPAPPFTIVAVE